MRWQQGRRSRNIEDRRHQPSRPQRVAGLGGGATVLVVVVALFFGVDPNQMLSLLNSNVQNTNATTAPVQEKPQEATLKDFLSVVLADTETVWGTLFQESGAQYRVPTLVLYRKSTPTACGQGQAAAGPFYCPADQKLYLDLDFIQTLKNMGAQGDFALAYVIAHEVGHHVQALTGTLNKVHKAKSQLSQEAANQLQVRTELQADCFAGVWAYHAAQSRNMLEAGDVEEGLRAAAAVGDDTLQKQAGRRIVPEAFTHGSAAQRQRWLSRGLNQGSPSSCATFTQSDNL